MLNFFFLTKEKGGYKNEKIMDCIYFDFIDEFSRC
jgi:hypothetical protein